MPLADLLRDQFGVKTRPRVNPVVSQVETVATKLADNNPNRLALIVINLGTTAMYIGLDSEVSAEKGIYVGANGGSLALIWNEDFDMVAWEWFAVAITSANKVYVIEVVEA